MVKKLTRVSMILSILALSTSFSLAFGILACSKEKVKPTTPTQTGAKKAIEEYIVVGALLGIPFWQDPIAGMKAAEKELGIKVTFIGPTDWSASKQIAQLQQALLKKPKGLVILPVDPNSINGIIDGAMKNKIPVIVADTDTPSANRLSFLGTDRYTAGEQAAQFFVKKLNGSGNIAVITLGSSLALETSLKGFKDYLKNNAPRIRVVTEIDGKGDSVTITNGVTTLLQGNNKIDGIFANGSQESSNVAVAVQQLQMQGKVLLVGQGATLRSTDIMQAVKNGIMTASITQRSYQQFYYAIKMLYDMHHVSWYKSLWNVGINPLPTHIDTGTIVITKENVDPFIQ